MPRHFLEIPVSLGDCFIMLHPVYTHFKKAILIRLIFKLNFSHILLLCLVICSCVNPIILAALNFGSSVYYIILASSILAFLLAKLSTLK